MQSTNEQMEIIFTPDYDYRKPLKIPKVVEALYALAETEHTDIDSYRTEIVQIFENRAVFAVGKRYKIAPPYQNVDYVRMYEVWADLEDGVVAFKLQYELNGFNVYIFKETDIELLKERIHELKEVLRDVNFLRGKHLK